MRISHLIPVVLGLSVIGAPAAVAQEAQRGAAVRIVAGAAREHAIFGDDSPKSRDQIVPGIGVQILARRSPHVACSFESVLQPSGRQNPHFDERFSALLIQAGPEIGGAVYVRPTLGIALQSWSGSRSCNCLAPSMAAGLAAGADRPIGRRLRVSPEFVARGSFAQGIATMSLGFQVGVGWRRESKP